MAGIGARACVNSTPARSGDARAQRRRDVGVFRVQHQTRESAVLVHEVPLVPEAERVPLQIRRHRQAHGVALSVEDERRLDRGRGLVVHGRVLEAELVLLRGPQHEPQLLEVGLRDPERVDEVDLVAEDPERLAREDDIGSRIPDGAGNFDVIRLASGGVGSRPARFAPGGRAAASAASRQRLTVLQARVRMCVPAPIDLMN